jgi:hypothetical protein
MTFGRFFGGQVMLLSYHSGVAKQALGNTYRKMWKGNVPWVESPCKLRDKGFRIAFQSIVRVLKRIQNPP